MNLNSREIATIIWVSAFVIYAHTKPRVRESIGQVFKAFSNRHFLSFFGLLLGYVALAFSLLHTFGIWDCSQLKVTLVWFLFVASASGARVHDPEPKIFKAWVEDNFK